MRTAFIITGLLLAFSAQGFQGDWGLSQRFRTQLQKAQQGDATAQYNIGHMYEKGRGTERNMGQALSWLERSAKQDYGPALARLGLIYFEGKGDLKPDFRAARRYLNLAAKQGIAQSQFYLGRMYEEGKGAKKNLDTALTWYQKAQKTGYYGVEKRIAAVKKATVIIPLLETPTRVPPKAKAPVVKASKKKASGQSAHAQLLKTQWSRGNRPAAYLPSSITQCKSMQVSGAIVCDSKPQTRQTLAARITYTTRARLTDFKDNGTFHLKYVNRVSAVESLAEGEAVVSVKAGEESRSHSMACSLSAAEKLTCVRDKVQTLEFTGG